MKTVLSPQILERTRELSDEALILALEAYREGRHQGAASSCAEIDDLVGAQIDQLAIDGTLTDGERLASIEALERVRVEISRVVRRTAQPPER